MTNLPAHRDDHTPAVPPPVHANVIYAYPLTPQPTQSLTDAGQLVMEVLAIFNEAGDKLQRAMRRAYPCVLCGEDLAGLNDWQQRRHFARHPLADRAKVVGWFRAVMGT